MSHAETDTLLIEKYFDKELTPAEKASFDQRIISDEQFKSLFHQEQVLVSAIRLQGLEDDVRFLRNHESTLKDSVPEPKQISMAPPSRKWYYVAAAAVISIIVLAKVFIVPSSSPEALYQAYIQPYPNLFEPTVRGTQEADTRGNAFLAYEQGKYEVAIPLFEDLLKVKEDPGVLLLLGNANLISGHVDEATKNFITLNDHFDELDVQSNWYLSLCYLSKGDSDRASSLLRELSESKTSYAAKAKELLQKIN